MENHKRNSNELADREQRWKELFGIIEEQLEIINKLKEIVEPLASSGSNKGVASTEERVSEAKDLFIELEALQAQERPIYHSLLETED